MQTSAQLLSKQDSLQAALATADARSWPREISPLKPVLEADIIQVFYADGSTLLSVRQPVLQDVSLDLDAQKRRSLSGTPTISLVDAKDALFSTLVATAPIGDASQQLGHILIGRAVTSQKLQTIAEQTGGQLVVFDGERQIASTFTVRGERFSKAQFSQERSQLTVTNIPYATKRIEIVGLDEKVLTVAIFQSLEPLRQLQRTLWLVAIGVAMLGGSFALVIGVWTARRIIRPLQAVTQTVQKVIETSDFSLQASVTTQDEVGWLADALNQLIVWIGSYTDALQDSQTALKTKIKTLQTLRTTQAQIIQSEKMSSLGEMVAGIAHEINNPVNFIHGNITYAKQYVEDLLSLLNLYQAQYPTPAPSIQSTIKDIELNFLRSDFPQILTSMKAGTTRVKEIVISLRNFSRLDEATLKTVDISEGIDSTLLILNHRIKQGVEIFKDYAYTGQTSCYPAQLNQVFMNILSNALDALESSKTDCPKISIHTQETEHQVIVSITDNGPGIPETVRAKIFDPFFTTKPVGQGTGLGLSICYQIVQKHSGTLSVSQVSPQGTKFEISLPIS